MTIERRASPQRPHERARETQLIFPDEESREQFIPQKSTANGLELKYPGLTDKILEARRQGMNDQQIEKYIDFMRARMYSSGMSHFDINEQFGFTQESARRYESFQKAQALSFLSSISGRSPEIVADAQQIADDFGIGVGIVLNNYDAFKKKHQAKILSQPMIPGVEMNLWTGTKRTVPRPLPDEEKYDKVPLVPATIERGWMDFVVGGINVLTSTMRGLNVFTQSSEFSRIISNLEEAAVMFSPEDPNYIDHAVQGIGSVGVFLLPGLLTAKGLAAAGLAPRIAAWTGASVPAVLESMGEAAGGYERVFQRTRSRKAALNAYWITFIGNLPLNVLTDKLAFFSGMGFVKGGLRGTVAESTQESLQSVLQDLAVFGDPRAVDYKQAMYEGATAIPAGFLFGGIGGMQQEFAMQESVKEFLAEQADEARAAREAAGIAPEDINPETGLTQAEEASLWEENRKDLEDPETQADKEFIIQAKEAQLESGPLLGLVEEIEGVRKNETKTEAARRIELVGIGKGTGDISGGVLPASDTKPGGQERREVREGEQGPPEGATGLPGGPVEGQQKTEETAKPQGETPGAFSMLQNAVENFISRLSEQQQATMLNEAKAVGLDSIDAVKNAVVEYLNDPASLETKPEPQQRFLLQLFAEGKAAKYEVKEIVVPETTKYMDVAKRIGSIRAAIRKMRKIGIKAGDRALELAAELDAYTKAFEQIRKQLVNIKKFRDVGNLHFQEQDLLNYLLHAVTLKKFPTKGRLKGPHKTTQTYQEFKEIQKEFSEYLKVNPEAAELIPQKVLDFVFQIPLNEMTVGQIAEIHELARTLVKKGREHKRQFDEARKMGYKETAHEIAAEMDSVDFTERARTSLMDDLKTEGKVKRGLKQIRWSNVRFWAIVKALAGGDTKSVAWKRFREAVNVCEDSYVAFQEETVNSIKEIFQETNLSPWKLYHKRITVTLQTAKGPMEYQFYLADAIGVWAMAKNPEQEAAILFGNAIPIDVIEKLDSILAANEKLFGERLMEFYAKNLPVLIEAHRQITGRSMVTVKNYLPMFREGVEYGTDMEEVEGMFDFRNGVLRNYVNRGRTKTRVSMSPDSQIAINTDIYASALLYARKIGRYVAYGKTVQDLQGIMMDEIFQNAVRNKFGDDFFNTLQHYVNILANPAAYRQVEKSWKAAKEFSYGARMRAAMAWIGLSLSVAPKQVLSLPLYLPYAGPANLLQAAGEFMANPAKLWRQNAALDPQFRNRGGPEIIIDQFRDAAKYKRVGAQKILNMTVGDWGTWHIRMFDRVAVTIGWRATYLRGIQMGMSQAEAAQYAQEVTSETQPATSPKDRSVVYTSSSEVLQWMYLFTNQITQNFSIATVDIPLDLKQKRYQQAAEKAAVLVMNSVLYYIMTYKIIPEDWKGWLRALGQVFSNLPVIGSALLSGIDGWSASPFPPVEFVKDIGGFVKALGDGKGEKAIKYFSRAIMPVLGLPYAQTKNTLDFLESGDPIDLFGGNRGSRSDREKHSKAVLNAWKKNR